MFTRYPNIKTSKSYTLAKYRHEISNTNYKWYFPTEWGSNSPIICQTKWNKHQPFQQPCTSQWTRLSPMCKACQEKTDKQSSNTILQKLEAH